MDFRKRDLQDIRLPVEYDLGVTTFKEEVDATEINSFDDLITYTPLELLDYEVHKYEPQTIPAYFNYFPTEDTKPLRPGAESEYSIRGIRGDPEIGEKANENKFMNMPSSMLAPLDYKQEKLVIPNPLLRVYTQLEKFSEIDVDHHLQPKIRKERELIDEISANHKYVDTESAYFSKYIPGNVASRVVRRITSKISDFNVPPIAIKECIAFTNIIKRLCLSKDK